MGDPAGCYALSLFSLIVPQDSKFRLQFALDPLELHSRGWRDNPAFQQRRYSQKCLSEIIDSATHWSPVCELPDNTPYSDVLVVTNVTSAKRIGMANPGLPSQ